MKRILLIALAFCLFLSAACAEEKTVTYNSIFGLSKGSTPEEIRKVIEKTFSVSPSSVDENNYYPEKKEFLGFPVEWVILNVNELFFVHRSFEISFTDESLTAENFFSAYRQLCDAFGDPSVCNITREIITLNGKEKEQLSVDDLSAIQDAIDQLNIYGIVCWDNISLQIYSSLYTSVSPSKELKSFKLCAAFSDASLENEVRDLYGIDLYK